jgi:hypothetical protein
LVAVDIFLADANGGDGTHADGSGSNNDANESGSDEGAQDAPSNKQLVAIIIIMAVFCALALLLRPLEDREQIRMDCNARVTNVFNLIVAWSLAKGFWSESTTSVADTALVCINIVNMLHLLASFRPDKWIQSQVSAYNDYKVGLDLRKAANEAKKDTRGHELAAAAREGNTAAVESLVAMDAVEEDLVDLNYLDDGTHCLELAFKSDISIFRLLCQMTDLKLAHAGDLLNRAINTHDISRVLSLMAVTVPKGGTAEFSSDKTNQTSAQYTSWSEVARQCIMLSDGGLPMYLAKIARACKVVEDAQRFGWFLREAISVRRESASGSSVVSKSDDATNEGHVFETETERTIVNLNGFWDKDNTDTTQRAIQLKVLDALTRSLAQSTWCGSCKIYFILL